MCVTFLSSGNVEYTVTGNKGQTVSLVWYYTQQSVYRRHRWMPVMVLFCFSTIIARRRRSWLGPRPVPMTPGLTLGALPLPARRSTPRQNEHLTISMPTTRAMKTPPQILSLHKLAHLWMLPATLPPRFPGNRQRHRTGRPTR